MHFRDRSKQPRLQSSNPVSCIRQSKFSDNDSTGAGFKVPDYAMGESPDTKETAFAPSKQTVCRRAAGFDPDSNVNDVNDLRLAKADFERRGSVAGRESNSNPHPENDPPPIVVRRRTNTNVKHSPWRERTRFAIQIQNVACESILPGDSQMTAEDRAAELKCLK
jgi:hypothetical protein